MKSIEFMYWLQGYFELTGSNTISNKQYEIIKKHLEMVKVVDKNNKLPFCSWLEGVFDIIQTTPTQEQTILIKNKLNDVFEHVVEQNINNKPQKPQKPSQEESSFNHRNDVRNDPFRIVKC